MLACALVSLCMRPRARASERERGRARARVRERYIISPKRDLLQCQKRPTTVSTETYYSARAREREIHYLSPFSLALSARAVVGLF